jgi:cephalosporin-C deacetylase
MEFPHDFPFDPRYGYDEAKLRKVQGPPGPPDFADFWRATYAQTMNVSPQAQVRPADKKIPGADVFTVEFNGLAGARIGGWITVPRDAVSRGELSRGVVVGHGYGGREGPDDRVPGPPAVAIFPCARGFHRSAAPGIPGTAAFHVIHGIDSRETYIHRMCVADLWSAASALTELYPQVRDCLDYSGGSFGGGIGAMAVPWDARIRRAFLDIPSFGNHPLRVTQPCAGSGEAIRLLHQRRPEIMNVLQYFDSATAAKHIHIPTMVACALFDPAVPPPGQFSVYNALPEEKELFIRPAAHFEYPEGAKVNDEVFAAVSAWFSKRE